MNNLSKALSLLSVVFGRDGEPVTPSQAAAATGIHLATCARIMSELVEAGYLDKVSRRSGYIGGPLIFALAGRPGVYRDIVEWSRGPLAELALELGATINLAIMEQGRRRLLLSAPPSGGRRVPLRESYESFEDFHDSATGRLLLARATKEERDAVAVRLKLTDDERDKLETAIAGLRGEKDTVFYHPGFQLWIIGAALEPPKAPAFAFGFGVPEERKDRAMAACRRTAAAIAARFQRREMSAF